jgi:diguanylate cyclase (GGDEF)-like protein
MLTETVTVCSRDGDLLTALRASVPEVRFTDDAAEPACVVILDDDSALGIRVAADSCVRIILTPPGEASVAESSAGEIHVDRGEFLASPRAVLRAAMQWSEAAGRAAGLESELEYLGQFQELTKMTNAAMVWEKITLTILGLLNLSHGTLLLHDPELERFAATFSNDLDFAENGDFLPGVPAPLLQSAIGSPEGFALEKAPSEPGLMVMPLQVGDDLVGVVRIPLTADDMVTPRMSRAVSKYLAMVARVLGNIYNLTRSRDLALRDDLTKAFNRRFFESYLDEEIERARRYGTIVSIIFLDLDDLKSVNKRHGHLIGSRTLQEVAKRVLGAVRGIDKVVRFGGDEFCIILPQTDHHQAVAVAARVRKAINASPFHLESDVEVTVTGSFGIASFPTHALNKDDLIRQADAAMYQVKSTTKNAVGIAAASPDAKAV